MREIAKNPQNRFDWWVCNKFNVLPTDDRFLDLTEEQREWMWENYLLDNPELEKKINNRFFDPTFQEEWDAMEVNEGEVNSSDEAIASTDDEDFSAFEEAFASYLEEHPEMDIKGKRKYDRMLEKQALESDEWEEVE